MNAIVRVPVSKHGSGFNPYQTGHGAFRDKKKERAYRNEEFRKLLAREMAK